MHSFKRQSGVAAIWFVLIFIALASLPALGVEGARYLNNKARLGDALETASLLLAADQAEQELKLDVNSGQYVKRKERTQILVEETVEAYLQDAKDAPELAINISERKDKKDNESFDYKVSAVTEHNSWMSIKSAPSFDETQGVANFAAATKTGGGGAADVILVVDHSMAMNKNTCTHQESPTKTRLQTAKLAVAHQIIKMFIEAVRKPGEKIDDPESLGRVAVIPYENATRNRVRDGTSNLPELCENQLIYKHPSEDKVVVTTGYGEINWIEALKSKHWYSPQEHIADNSEISKYIEYSTFKMGNEPHTAWLPSNRDHVDIQATIFNAVTNGNLHRNADLLVDGSQLVLTTANRLCKGYMESIPLDHPDFNDGVLDKKGMLHDPFTLFVGRFNSGSFMQKTVDGKANQYLGGWTSSFQGILRGAQELKYHKEGSPLLFVVVAGGPDTPGKGSNVTRTGSNAASYFQQDLLTKDLLDAGLFTRLKAKYGDIRFVLMKFEGEYELNYQHHFDEVIPVNYLKASGAGNGDTSNGLCKNFDIGSNNYDFDDQEMAKISGQVAKMLGDAGHGNGSGGEEIGSIYDRRAK